MTTRRGFLGQAVAAPLLAAAEEPARKAAENWLALLDQGKYREAWKRTSQHQRQITVEEWVGQMKAMREAAGVLSQRNFMSAKLTRTLAGAPDGEYMLLEFSTAFEKKPKAVESLMMSREGGGWKAAGYFIR